LLAAAGVGRGDRISILSENSIEALVAFWGGLRAGAIVNPVNVEIRAQHVSHILEAVAPKGIFWAAPHRGGEGFDPARWVRLDEWRGRLESAPDAPIATPPRRADWSLIDYTSGTTDLPKGAIWTHEAYYAMCESTIDRLGIGEADTILDY